MKTYIIITASLLFFQATLSANELSWVDTQVDAIKPARVGISDSEILKTEDPFIFYKKDLTKDKNKKVAKVAKSSNKKPSSTTIAVKQAPPSMKISAIINNSALINGKWYKVNQNIAGFTVSSITRTNVVLTKGKKKLVLSTNDQNRNLKFK